MPRLPLRPCPRVGCRALVRGGGYCPEHRPKELQRTRRETDRARGSAARRGYGRHWRKARLNQLAREPLCRHCQAAGKVVAASQVDHITALKDGGADDDSNYQSLCDDCHAAKTIKDIAARRARGA